MPDLRIHRSITQRADIDFARRPDPLRRRRRRLVWGAAILAVSPAVYAMLTGDETIYWSRSCSTAHQVIQHDCRRCHIERFQSLLLDLEGQAFARSVEDRSCRTCHNGRNADDHHPDQIVDTQVRSCFDCHREHLDRERLTAVADGHCTACHSHLESKHGSPHFATAIGSFDEHPEFAIRRDGGQEPEPGARHAALGLANLDRSGTEWTWRDAGRLHFDHQTHVHPDGVRAPDRDGGGTHVEHLACDDCHQPTPDGRYMQPIHYETHCRRCHPLTYGPELFQFAIGLDLGGPLPHEEPRIVRDALLNRLKVFADTHEDEIIAGEAAAAPRLPNKRSRPGLSARDKFEWVTQRLQQIESIVFGRDPTVRFPRFMQSCTYCHEIESDPQAAPDGLGLVLPGRIVPTAVPQRWLPHSRFRHDAHDDLDWTFDGKTRQIDCTDCHYRIPPGRRPTGDVHEIDAARQGTIFASTTERDILIPSIETCRQCHGSGAASMVSQPARSSCVTCHGYHHSQ